MSGSNSLRPGAVGPEQGPGEAVVPPEPLSFAVHSLPSPSVPAAQVRYGRLKMLLVLLVCASPVIASYLTYYVIRPQGGRTNHGVLIDPQRPLPTLAALPLADLKGVAVDPASLKGQWLLVVVAAGACNELCERQLYLQRQLRESLGKNKDRVDRVWLIDDAAAPRAELMPALDGATVLRVPRDALARWLEPAAGELLEAHLYLVDPLGNWMMRMPAPTDASPIKRDLEKLMRGAASWDEAGR